MPNTKTAGSKTSKASPATGEMKETNGSNAGTANGPKPGSSNGSKSGSSKSGSTEMASVSQAGKGQGNTQLEKYFHDALKDIYWAEKHLTKALPKMQKAATTDQLKTALKDHLAQTQEHIARVEQVFELIGKKAQAKKCDAMEGILKEGESIVEETEDGSMTRDVGIIMAAQKVEHYEIATYGGLVTLATTMGLDEAASILGQTLEEEKQTDADLSSIAENNINWEAEQQGEGESEDESESASTEDDEND